MSIADSMGGDMRPAQPGTSVMLLFYEILYLFFISTTGMLSATRSDPHDHTLESRR
ncbi:MAG: hypothetical protein MZU95_00165 [Desulfomicrobium escambiense]|nr:hypothetical protein [Desulfomicrobium escambiense]